MEKVANEITPICFYSNIHTKNGIFICFFENRASFGFENHYQSIISLPEEFSL